MFQEKVVIQAVCLRTQTEREDYGYLEKVRKFQLFELCKKTTGGIEPPPPAGIGLIKGIVSKSNVLSSDNIDNISI